MKAATPTHQELWMAFGPTEWSTWRPVEVHSCPAPPTLSWEIPHKQILCYITYMCVLFVYICAYIYIYNYIHIIQKWMFFGVIMALWVCLFETSLSVRGKTKIFIGKLWSFVSATNTPVKKNCWEASLVVQWLRLTFQCRGCGFYPCSGSYNPTCFVAKKKKTQNIKQKQYCNKFNKDFKNGPHSKKRKKINCWEQGLDEIRLQNVKKKIFFFF